MSRANRNCSNNHCTGNSSKHRSPHIQRQIYLPIRLGNGIAFAILFLGPSVREIFESVSCCRAAFGDFNELDLSVNNDLVTACNWRAVGVDEGDGGVRRHHILDFWKSMTSCFVEVAVFSVNIVDDFQYIYSLCVAYGSKPDISSPPGKTRQIR